MLPDSNQSASIAPIIPPLGNHGRPTKEFKTYNHHLVVHFDVNETILVGDDAGGDTRLDCLNKLLAKSAFVRMPDKSKVSYEETSSVIPTHWWDGTLIGDDSACGKSIPPLYIGWEWPEGCCPYYRTSFKKKSKTFTDHDGAPYRVTLEKVDDILEHRGVSDLPVLNHMLPAFFKTLEYLSRTTQKTTIVIRTFGNDLPDIAKAVTAFAQGYHPDYPHFLDKNLIMEPECIVTGRWQQSADGRTVYRLFQGDTQVAAGDEEVLAFIHSRTICGIQDDYPFWRSNGYEPWSGKPVWKLPDVQHVLLDDNIHNLEHDSIASVRECTASGMFESLTSQEIRHEQGTHLIRVPTIAPILHPDWFLEMIDKAQEKFSLGTAENHTS